MEITVKMYNLEIQWNTIHSEYGNAKVSVLSGCPYQRDETNIFPIRSEQASSIRLLLYRLSPCCFLVCVKLVYVQAVREKCKEVKTVMQ